MKGRIYPNTKHYLGALALVMVIGCAAQAAHAESPAICAQVVPCDENGDLLPEFSDQSSPCYEHYLTACQNASTNELVKKFRYCEDSRQSSDQVIQRLMKENSRLKRLARKRRDTRRQ